MDIDVWEVVDAAATKPFGFMSLPARARASAATASRSTRSTSRGRRASSTSTREFIELAGKVNENMPYFCRSIVSQALNHGAQKSVKGSRILVLGVAYKADIGDTRESPALEADRAAAHRGRRGLLPRPARARAARARARSRALEPEAYDCVVIVTAHSAIDYAQLVEDAPLVVDFRNATGEPRRRSDKVWKL